jgi:hypothetical protein
MNDSSLSVDEFHDAKLMIDSVFDIERRLPDFVFVKDYRFYLICEFGFEMQDLLKAMQNTKHDLVDDKIMFCVLDPDPINFFSRSSERLMHFISMQP